MIVASGILVSTHGVGRSTAYAPRKELLEQS